VSGGDVLARFLEIPGPGHKVVAGKAETARACPGRVDDGQRRVRHVDADAVAADHGDGAGGFIHNGVSLRLSLAVSQSHAQRNRLSQRLAPLAEGGLPGGGSVTGEKKPVQANDP